MKTHFAWLGITLGFVVACSADKTDSGSLAGNGSGNKPPGAAGATTIDVINTDSGQTSDAGTDCTGTLPVTYRDFSEAHPDFEMPFPGDVVRRGLVASELGPDHKPVFADRVGQAALESDPLATRTDYKPTQPVIQSADSFKQWYNNTPGINQEFQKQLVLTESGVPGIYGFESSAFFPLEPTEGFGVTPKN